MIISRKIASLEKLSQLRGSKEKTATKIIALWSHPDCNASKRMRIIFYEICV